MTDTDNKIQEILATFEPYDGVYHRQAVDDAIQLQEEITPHLIVIVQDVATNPGKYILNDIASNIYALMLLAYFQESKAHQSIVELFSLPEHFIDPLFGDLITEDLPSILVQTCGGDVEQIKQLILNKNAYEYCRSGAATALTYAVIKGYESREDAQQFLSTLFTGTEDDNPDSGFWAMILDDLVNLYPEELMPVVEKAFADDLIDEFFIDLDYMRELMAKGEEAMLQRLREEMEQRAIDDIHTQISWWAMFDSEEDDNVASSSFMPTPSLLNTSTVSTSKKKKAKKKNKRKMAKASKKKNRR